MAGILIIPHSIAIKLLSRKIAAKSNWVFWINLAVLSPTVIAMALTYRFFVDTYNPTETQKILSTVAFALVGSAYLYCFLRRVKTLRGSTSDHSGMPNF